VTVAEAIGEVRRVGVVGISGGNLKIKFPDKERAALAPAIEVLRGGKAEALALLSEPLSETGVRWADWKAAELNRLFQEQGTSGQPCRITAATVRHSLESSCNGSVE
jgi:hypothetical protein